ncbi:hypothetical protein E05_12760 [Plautia stali symbiont]|nr:hypothetical protein E05_12760 [Plautia stali symbiont]
MTARRARRHGFACEFAGLTAAFGVDVKAVNAGFQPAKRRRELQTIPAARFHRHRVE